MSETNAQIDNKQPISPKGKAPITGDGAHVIVIGNEKGGTGKSTTAMHIAVALLRLGYKVGTIDLDARQATFSRYLQNRLGFIKHHKKYIPTPSHFAIEQNLSSNVQERREADELAFEGALAELSRKNHFVIVDTPGSSNHLSRFAHGHADTLITPINDCFVDLDLLAIIDPDSYKIKSPSVYTRMVDTQRGVRRKRDGGTINWIVMRNRLSHVNSKNKQQISALLQRISEFAGLTIAPGYGERVVFRELFLKGLTLLDLKHDNEQPMTLSQLTARQEVRQLIIALDPEKLKGRVSPLRKKKRA